MSQSIVIAMKKFLSALIVITVISVPLSTKAQERNGCFIRDSRGNTIELGHLCGNTTPQTKPKPPSAGTFRIPIKRREGGTPIVDVTFNGKKSFEMLFDTGATETVITPDMAKILGVRIEGTVPVATAGGVIQAGIGRVSSAHIGSFVVKDMTIGISPHLPIGLLGQNFYGSHDITIKKDFIEFHIRK